jgi:ABC-type transport system involved in multi-copper enzyme maturation permease subunit
MVIVWVGQDPAALAAGGRITLQAMAKVGEGFFYALAGIQISLVLLGAPAAAAGAICSDRASGALLHMFVTDLSDAEIVLGKLSARLTPILGMIACGLPVAGIAGLLGGIDFGALAGLFVVSLALTLLGCVLALAISLVAPKTHEVLMAVHLIEGLALLALPIWWVLAGPAGAPPPAWFQKANPYMLVFSPYTRPGFVSAIDYERFVAVVVALSALLVAATTVCLRPVVVAQSGRAEKAGHRIPAAIARLVPTLVGPSLDGNPVLWREWHRNRPSRMARRMWQGLMFVTALLAAWGTYDLILNGPGRARGGSAGLGLAMMLQLAFGFLILSATAPTVLAEERVRGSLDLLLSTPLSTRSIVVGKWWGVYRRVFQMAPIPVYAVILMAATVPATRIFPAGVRLPYRVVPLMPWERVAASAVASADFLFSGALLVGLGLVFATWTRRLGRAVTLSVIAFFLLAIGLPILGELVFQQLMNVFGRPDWLIDHRWAMLSVMSMSPIFGPTHPIDILFDYSWTGRAPQWVAACAVILLKATLAFVVFCVSVASFDRSLGRVAERKRAGALANELLDPREPMGGAQPVEQVAGAAHAAP